MTSNVVIIQPINSGQTGIKTVTLNLNGSPLLNPVNYQIGSPSVATVYIEPPGVTNLPPVAALLEPTNGEVYAAPADISIMARASDADGSISNVEFFAGTNDLGSGTPVILDPIAGGGISGLVYLFNWSNVAAGEYSLTAIATDAAGLSTTSAPVDITVISPSAGPMVRITSPPDGAFFRAPIHIPLYAYAAAPGASITSVDIFG